MKISGKWMVAQFWICLLSCSLLRSQSAAPPADNPDVFRVGGVSLALHTPAEDLVEIGSDFRPLLEPLAPDTNRLVAAFVTPQAKNALGSHSVPQLENYALIEIPRRAEFSTIDTNTYQQVAAALRQQFAGDLTGTVQNQQDELNRKLKALGSTNTVTMDKPLPLGEFFSKPDACGFGMIIQMKSGDKAEKMAMALSLLRVHDRIVFAYLYSLYKDESTVAWLRSADQQWADAILAANR